METGINIYKQCHCISYNPYIIIGNKIFSMMSYSNEESAQKELDGLTKAINGLLVDFSNVLKDKFNNKIPSTINELVQLPGVGRKTANLVVVMAFKKQGVCVDVHVHRIMNRLGYVRTKTPLETEIALRKKLPQKYWRTINSILVAFGQNLCRPVSPHCNICKIKNYCNKVNVGQSR